MLEHVLGQYTAVSSPTICSNAQTVFMALNTSASSAVSGRCFLTLVLMLLHYVFFLSAMVQAFDRHLCTVVQKQSVSGAQCDVTITYFSFVLPNLTDGSCSHEGISAPHPPLSLWVFLFHLNPV